MNEKTPSRSQAERALRLAAYLRKHSDEEHPVKPRQMEQYFAGCEMPGFLGDKKTRQKLLQGVAAVLNSDEQGHPLPEEQWRLHFHTPEENEDEPDGKRVYHVMRELYYRQEFTRDEIDMLIGGVQFYEPADADARRKLIAKIKEHLATAFYQPDTEYIEMIKRPESVHNELLRRNLALLQEAIRDKVKIAFVFSGYDCRKRLVPTSREKYILSPYYIVAYASRYYLLGASDKHKNLSIWRVDLMTDIVIPGRDMKAGNKGVPAMKKADAAGVPAKWDERFVYRHLNMSFDEPVEITLRITPPENDRLPGYTFLHDWFGDTFRFMGQEDGCGIVKVMCSPYAMANWALQYADRVEVVAPESVRQMVAQKVESLRDKYLK